ncbi:FAD-dependent oxidoreductase [Neolewinella antarctica]|uniref:NADPH-dependent 2,4-dienoyl-CoA reductase/sulfur reductase-like enzyme/nitrite reductase/ring-hydroxylating ferredoxin subunit n=1 Tax=Neolewinella antarctica TaxID=442734 RepID=A0ABX0X683_9BACT|nr:FAD-dependent oxidoreductase [Neolewinella antarctica]NJC24721.1 NADPH-dependent 2,4-dienoyl-CoA reductase/sulfur reductase-like enzyme/nitrite reductase/ring-hydroxylating ferredoxin subunit [Neolewinella antarctica]
MTQVFQLSNLPTGHTHQLDHGEFKVLLTNVGGEVYAVESKCSHYALPLENAALCEHRLRCPFHHACFDVRTGAQLEAPGLDGIATFKVEVRDGDIFVADQPNPAPSLDTASRQSTGLGSGQPATATAPAEKTTEHFTYAIVGGGIAAANAVYGIREHDREGSIVMITSEDLPPYDRTKVSKALLSGDANVPDLPLHGEAFYEKHGVTLLEKTTAETVNVHDKTIKIADRTISYDKVLLATGAKPRKLDIPGAKLGNTYTIRDARDGRRIREQVKKGTRVVVIGGSFIGLETAMSLGKKGGKITVISPEEVLFEKVFGEQVGKYVQALHEEKGVTFELGTKATELQGKGSVNAVILDNGKRIKTDIVVVGIGVIPATSYLEGLASNDDGGISVDNHLAANTGGAWVAGDIAQYPGRNGAVRIEHWKVAAQQGRVAGRNMAGHAEPYTALPFFWSNQQGTNFRYVGHAEKFDEIIFDGTPGEGPFLAYYLNGGELLAVLGVKRDADLAIIGEAMEAGSLPPNDQLVGFTWPELLTTA